jgi:hypothetical protein
LFRQVLKDLARAFESGSKAQLFRQNAFNTSLKIVDKCKRVFVEIDTILKATNCKNSFAGNFRIPTGHKILWLDKKGKVEFFRRLLGSLKSAILVELTVLTYVMKVTKHTVKVSWHPSLDFVTDESSKDRVNVDELLALKTLVLANDTAKQELHLQAACWGEMLVDADLSTQ